MDLNKIGKYIAGKRKALGLTQRQIVEKLNMSDKSVSKWERGKSLPDSGIMLEVCNILKINVNELLSGERIMTNVYHEKAEKIFSLCERKLTGMRKEKLAEKGSLS